MQRIQKILRKNRVSRGLTSTVKGNAKNHDIQLVTFSSNVTLIFGKGKTFIAETLSTYPHFFMSWKSPRTPEAVWLEVGGGGRWQAARPPPRGDATGRCLPMHIAHLGCAWI